MKHADALKIAKELIDRFQPACIRIEIKGSVCRMKAEPGDIELLAIPDLSPLPRPKIEFGRPIPTVYKTRLDALVAEMEEVNICYLKASGDKYKKFWMNKERIQVDLFLVTPPAQWGVLSVIRTGPSDFSHWMVTRQSKGGALPDQYIVDGGVVGNRMKGPGGFERQGEIPMPEEIDFFDLCGLEWIEPKNRVAKWRMQ